MKQLIILLLLIIAFFIGYGKYAEYKRYNSPKVEYTSNTKIDLEYYNQEMVLNYFKAIEDVNSYIKMQWTANSIDIRTPKEEDDQTKIAIDKYSSKLARIKYYEAKLERSSILKENGFSNKEIKFLEKGGIDYNMYIKIKENDKIKSMFDDSKKFSYGQTSALIYEVQKKLVKNGFDIKVDGIYKIETKNAIKDFEAKSNLFADGILDVLTLNLLFK